MKSIRPTLARRILARPRSHALAWLLPIGAVLLATGCANSGTLETRPLLTQRGVDTTTDLRIAQTALESGDLQLAVSLFDKALKADPRSNAAQLGLADAMYGIGDLARAGMLYARVAAASSADAPQDRSKVLKRQLRSMPRGARARATALTPAGARAELGLARVALRERHLDEAVMRYRALLDAHPDSTVAAEGLGAALDLQGRHADAQAIYRTALAHHPEAQGLKADLGLSLILARHAREGANVLLDIAGLPDAPPQARQNLALAYGLLGNSEAAKRILLADLPATSADDNLQFYRNVRARMAAADHDRPAAQASPAPTGSVPGQGASR